MKDTFENFPFKFNINFPLDEPRIYKFNSMEEIGQKTCFSANIDYIYEGFLNHAILQNSTHLIFENPKFKGNIKKAKKTIFLCILIQLNTLFYMFQKENQHDYLIRIFCLLNFLEEQVPPIAILTQDDEKVLPFSSLGEKPVFQKERRILMLAKKKMSNFFSFYKIYPKDLEKFFIKLNFENPSLLEKKTERYLIEFSSYYFFSKASGGKSLNDFKNELPKICFLLKYRYKFSIKDLQKKIK